jgi:hypothetical protein
VIQRGAEVALVQADHQTCMMKAISYHDASNCDVPCCGVRLAGLPRVLRRTVARVQTRPGR